MTAARRLTITIVTPSLDQAEFVERAVESVLSQEGDFALEYLVYDGGSTDGTIPLLEKYGSRLRLTVERDTGQANAINKGLRAATGDVVGWLNSDDLLAPGALAAVADVFRAEPETRWLHGRCEIIDRRDRVIRPLVSRYKDWRCRHHSFRSLLVENYISQMTVFWRRTAQAEVGLLDESLHYTFDYDLWLRLARRWPPRYLPRVLASFRWHPSSKSGTSYVRQFEEDHEVFRRHAPGDPWLHALKRLRTGQIVGTYKLMDALHLRG